MLLIKDGRLRSGDRLPTERELAKHLSIARGTINKAYTELERNNVIENTQGRGTFVSEQQDILAAGRREQAVNRLNDTIAKLETLKFSHREISTLFQIILMERGKRLEGLHIAAIDCNPEALSIFERQLRYKSPTKIYKFLLDDLQEKKNPQEALGEFDLILAPANHYSEILGSLPGLKDKIVKVAVSVSQQTVIDLARISASSKLGILCQSDRFLKIIKARLKSFQIPLRSIRQVYEKDSPDIADFLADLDVVIVPPDLPILSKKENIAVVQYFQRRGGQIIEFNHQIDRGTLIHIEERISRILETR
ncbi:MAG: GntR family transcriptional regulator [Planctomycetales bacterium]|nr:GntR family transcriptional regulator [Planctomycetales bacterium]